MRHVIILLFITLIGSIVCKAQNKNVEVVTISVVSNNVLTSHLDTFFLYYSANRGGVALPMINKSHSHVGMQPLHFDSMISNSGYTKHYKEYDASNNIVKDRRLGVVNTITDYLFDTSHQLLSKTSNRYQNGLFLDAIKDSFIYNNGILISELVFNKRQHTLVWEISDKHDYTYSGKNISKEEYYKWHSGKNSLEIVYKTRFYYTLQQLDSSIHYIYPFNIGNTKVVLGKSYYTYNNNMLRQTETLTFADTVINTWATKRKVLYSYNTNNDLIEENILNWNANLNVWEEDSKNIYIYNNNEVDTTYEMRWNANASMYEPRRRSIFYYVGGTNLFQYRINQYKHNSSWVFGNGSIFDTVHVYHYDKSGFIGANTSVNEKNQSNILSLYPNPAKSVLTVDIPDISNKGVKISVYDMQGKLYRQLTSGLYQGRLQIPVASLPEGTYFIEASTENYRRVEKFTISR